MRAFLLSSTATALLLAAPRPAAAADNVDLDVTRVAIFNSGVAYYESTAQVEGAGQAELTFRTEQINDILKSLIVQDLGGGRIGAVSYASQDPIEKTLKSFGVDITDNPTLGELLDQLRGEPVEVTADKLVRGVIVGVEQQQRKVDDTTQTVDLLNVLTAEGIQRFELARLGGVKLTNERVAGELRAALETLARGHDTSKKTVRIGFEGQGRRPVRVAYLLEAPIWKTTYRLVLDDEQAPFLQGWATVENATEEDWENVQLSLVSGRPISFVMDLYSPIYVPRPREELELYASLRPPTYEGAQYDQLRSLGYAGDDDEAASKLSTFGGGRRGRAAGSARAPAAEMGRAGETITLGVPLQLEDAGVASVASAADAGELFEYTIDTPVTIPRQRSAMLPIVNEAVQGEKVSIYNPGTHAKHPLNGLEFENATALHLLQGPVTLFDGSIYAGDAKLPDLKPGEKRLIAYALDLATEVDVNRRSHPARVTATKIVRGALIQTRKFVDEREYVVTNKSDRQRTVLLEQPYGDDWKLVEPEKPYERTASLSRFKLQVPARATARQVVRIENVTDQSIALGSLYADQMRVYLRGQSLAPEVQAALEQLIELQATLEATRREIEASEAALNEARSEQARVRENLKTLREDSDPYRRQLQKFDEFETRIEQTTTRLAELRAREQAELKAVEAFLQGLNVG